MADATEFRKAGTVVGIAVVMATLFATVYTVALGRPLPHDLPIGVVGAGAPAVLAQLGEQQQGFTLYPYPTRQAAEAAVDQQRIAATLVGFVTMFQLRANVKTLTVRRWIAWAFVLAVVGGFALAVVTGPVLHALGARFGELWLLISAQIGVAALFNSTMLVLLGRWAILRPGHVHPARQHVLRRSGVGVAAAAAVRVPQPRSAQRCHRVGAAHGQLFPGQSATAAVRGARSVAGRVAGRVDHRLEGVVADTC